MTRATGRTLPHRRSRTPELLNPFRVPGHAFVLWGSSNPSGQQSAPPTVRTGCRPSRCSPGFPLILQGAIESPFFLQGKELVDIVDEDDTIGELHHAFD